MVVTLPLWSTSTASQYWIQPGLGPVQDSFSPPLNNRPGTYVTRPGTVRITAKLLKEAALFTLNM